MMTEMKKNKIFPRTQTRTARPLLPDEKSVQEEKASSSNGEIKSTQQFLAEPVRVSRTKDQRKRHKDPHHVESRTNVQGLEFREGFLPVHRKPHYGLLRQ